jgi:hypothetical protein
VNRSAFSLRDGLDGPRVHPNRARSPCRSVLSVMTAEFRINNYLYVAPGLFRNILAALRACPSVACTALQLSVSGGTLGGEGICGSFGIFGIDGPELPESSVEEDALRISMVPCSSFKTRCGPPPPTFPDALA